MGSDMGRTQGCGAQGQTEAAAVLPLPLPRPDRSSRGPSPALWSGSRGVPFTRDGV